MDIELDKMKQINLVEYAASKGYTVIRQKSSVYSKTLRNADGDKIVVMTGRNSHSIYFNVHNAKDNGTIIDFVQNRTGKTLGQVRQELRPWLSFSSLSPLIKCRHQLTKPLKTNRCRRSVMLNYHRTVEIRTCHPYLSGRGIDIELIHNPRFRGKIRQDIYGNVTFPHFDRDGLCGYEIKGTQYSGFCKGGEKGLWFSNFTNSDNRLVVMESTIDALSYHKLHGSDHTRYVSTGGSISHRQIDLLKGAITKIDDQGGLTVCAFDNDKMGIKYTQQLFENMTLNQRRKAKSHVPEKDKDWNDALKAALKQWNLFSKGG